jgi:hypothetical protein
MPEAVRTRVLMKQSAYQQKALPISSSQYWQHEEELQSESRRMDDKPI